MTLPTLERKLSMADLILKAGKERSLLRRHPWIYATAIAKLQGNALPGDTVQVKSANGDWLACAAYSPSSQLRARAWTFDPQERIDRDFFIHRIQAAIEARKPLREHTNAIRIIFGEADGLPGLVVDQYDDWLVVQLLAAGVEYWREVIIDVLLQETGCTQLYERSDAAVRTREGLEPRSGNVKGAYNQAIRVTENGVHYGIDIANGHKTGFYIDQRENRALVQALCQERAKSASNITVLNCFSYTGGFSLAARKGGAHQVVSVDSSQEALDQAWRNAQLNNMADPQFEAVNANVFDYLKTAQTSGQLFDMVILDPPKFAPSSHHVDKAARAYKDLNMRGLKLLKPGGHLLTFSCSGAVSVDLFQKIVAGAVIDSNVDAQLQRRLAAGIDHPMAMTHPEGEYLKGLLLRI
jgi:23S rRNA (cytosine1962-C5)-methyltransferase